jgi:hypothetical protein
MRRFRVAPPLALRVDAGALPSVIGGHCRAFDEREEAAASIMWVLFDQGVAEYARRLVHHNFEHR